MCESVDNAAGVTCFVISTQCLLHVYHRMFKKSLEIADHITKLMQPFQNAGRNYFSSLVKILHTWRDNAKKMKQVARFNWDAPCCGMLR